MRQKEPRLLEEQKRAQRAFLSQVLKTLPEIWPIKLFQFTWEPLMRNSMLIITLLLAIANTAIASSWVEVVKGINESTGYIDTDSIRQNGHMITVWSRHMFYQPQTIPGLGTFNEMRIKQVIDCEARTSAHLLVRLYDRGKEVRSEAANPPQAKPILPGGIADMTRRKVCKDLTPE